jgi:phosphate ABC transporter permease subunit PstA
MKKATLNRTLKSRAVNSESSLRPMLFYITLWFSLLFGLLFLATLLFDIISTGAARLDLRLFTEFPSSSPDRAGARPAILGSIWVIATTAMITVPLGVAAAIHLEEFANKKSKINRFVEINVQNLAAVPSVVYGLLALAFLSAIGLKDKNIVIAGAFALSLLILPVVIISTREALRSVPVEIRMGSLALGATPLQTTLRSVLPAAVPGIATGSILALSRALGEAAPLLLLGALVFVSFDPNGFLSGYTTMPIQIFNWTGRPQEEFHILAAATSVILMGILLMMNGLAIFIRNKFQKRY